jgi:hypothetical protein
MGVIGSETYHRTIELEGKDAAGLQHEIQAGAHDIIKEISRLADNMCLKVCIVAVAEPIPPELRQKSTFTSDLWLRLDSIP